MKRLIVGTALVLSMLGSCYAGIDAREFANDGQRQRFYDLATVLRCPKCQNQNIAESGAPIANDLRNEIHRMLKAGQNDQQIIDFMVARYGDFVLYDPPLSSRTVLLWLGPGMLLLVGGAAIVAIVANRRRTRFGNASSLTDAERNRLASLLRATSTSIEQDS